VQQHGSRGVAGRDHQREPLRKREWDRVGALRLHLHSGGRVQAAEVGGRAVAFAAVNAHLHTRGDALLQTIWVKESRDADHDYERWNAFSRLTLQGDPDDPATTSAGLTIDSTAGTKLNRYSGDPDDSDFLRDEIQNPAALRAP